MNFHFYTSSDLFDPQNFTLSYDGIDTSHPTNATIFSNDLVNALNYRLDESNPNQGNPVMQLPVENSTPNIPYHFRFRLNGVFMHTAGDPYPVNSGDAIDVYFLNSNKGIGAMYNNAFIEIGLLHDAQANFNDCDGIPHNIDWPEFWDLNQDGLLTQSNCYPNCDSKFSQFGFANYGSDAVWIVNSWIQYRYDAIGNCWENAYSNLVWSMHRQVFHEIGHAFCLAHTILQGNGNPCGNIPDDYCSDTPAAADLIQYFGWHPQNYTPEPAGQACLQDCDASIDGFPCGNNLMDYCYNSLALTPHQLGRFYYSLYIHHLFAVEPDYCQHDQSNTSIESGEQRIWEGMRICKGDITIKAGGMLTLKGRLWMPHKGKIIVEPGAQFLVDGGCIGNRCGDLWE